MNVFSELNQANNRNGDLLTEIYRLQAENAKLKEQRRAWEQTVRTSLTQSDAEPVAWQYRVKQGGWGGWHDAVPSREEAELCVELGRKASGGHLDDYEIRPLYTAPPRPDTSAGLLEAAAWLEANNTKWGASWSPCVMSCAQALRDRAADRNME